MRLKWLGKTLYAGNKTGIELLRDTKGFFYMSCYRVILDKFKFVNLNYRKTNQLVPLTKLLSVNIIII